jgi:DNA-binding transcriptional MerR regulator
VTRDDRTGLIPIGRFARLANLSPRQLRYYHALGLLPPAAIDPSSGYRYYGEAQRATAELIALLRSVDMPVPEIQSLLADRSPANVRRVFDRLRSSVEDRLRQAREVLDRLDTLSLEESVVTQQESTVYPYEAFTDESREVLQLTQRLADDAGAAQIGPEHMLAALASERAGAAGVALRGLGLDTEAILGATAPSDSQKADQPEHALPSGALRDLIAGAFAAVGIAPGAAGERVIDTRTLLLSTVRGDEAAGALRRLGVEPARVLAALGD